VSAPLLCFARVRSGLAPGALAIPNLCPFVARIRILRDDSTIVAPVPA